MKCACLSINRDGGECVDGSIRTVMLLLQPSLGRVLKRGIMRASERSCEMFR